MASEALLEHLGRFGFSRYEGLAYTTLLRHGPLSGYELASRSGVPRSKIYEILNHLMEKSTISPIQGNPVTYVAQNPAILVKALRSDVDQSLAVLAEQLPRGGDETSNYIWNLTSRESFLAKAVEMIQEAQRRILLYCFENELEKLAGALRRKAQLDIAILQLGDFEVGVGVVYHHLLPEQKRGEKGGRDLTLVVDDAHLLQGTIKDRQTCVGVFTTSPPLVDVACDFIRHDIYCWKLINRFESRVRSAFGEDLTELRRIFQKDDSGGRRGGRRVPGP